MIERIIPLFIILVFLLAAIKKRKTYDLFVGGARKAFELALGILPYLVAISIMTELFTLSGLNNALIDLLANFFNFFGIDKRLVPLILLKPFSGSGSLSLVTKIMQENGVDSYISRVAATIYGSSETIFYISAVYFSACKKKPTLLPVLIVLVSNFISVVFACFICRVL